MTDLFNDYEKNLDKILEIGRNVVKTTNRNKAFPILWRDEFAPSPNIGFINGLLEKYGTCEKNVDIKDFTLHYLSDPDPNFDNLASKGSGSYGRSPEQVEMIARRMQKRLEEKKIFFKGNGNIETLMCLIIYHVCVETNIGIYYEMLVREHLNTFNGYHTANYTDIDDSEWDKNGVDILYYRNKTNKIIRFIQVKPISFAISSREDVVFDRKKCLSINQKYVNAYITNHTNEIDDMARSNILYCFYDDERDGFIEFKNLDGDSIFTEFDTFSDSNGIPKYTFQEIKNSPIVQF